MELDANQIQEILPHRPPFLLVDRITGGEPGVWAQGIKCVTVNEPFFAGHFPGYHVMPGVLIMEALAQVGLWLSCPCRRTKGKLAFVTGEYERTGPGSVTRRRWSAGTDGRSSVGVASW